MQESKLLFHELPPFFEKDSETLILGSFPSPKSRECGFYYGHPQNRFWKTLAAVFKEEIPVNIEEKKEFLRRQKIALWDVIASCEIKGAEDGSIRRAKANDLSVILNAAAIRKILTTGKTAFCLYQTLCEPAAAFNITGQPCGESCGTDPMLPECAVINFAAVFPLSNGQGGTDFRKQSYRKESNESQHCRHR